MSIKRVKSKQLLPNAIRLRTKNRDEYLFAGYIPRERIFLSIDRLRQNALQERVSLSLKIITIIEYFFL